MKNVPCCPVCGEKLNKVFAIGKSVWLYDQGHYDNIENLDSTLICPSCGSCLDEVFSPNIYYWGIE